MQKFDLVLRLIENIGALRRLQRFGIGVYVILSRRHGHFYPHECLLVVDATIGQNVLSQVREFDEAVGLTGLIVTKLDGTAKAGVLFALSNDRVNKLPIYFVGLGEGIDDMEPFDSEAYVEALLDLN